jgi:hypothetical protein
MVGKLQEDSGCLKAVEITEQDDFLWRSTKTRKPAEHPFIPGEKFIAALRKREQHIFPVSIDTSLPPQALSSFFL